MTSTNTSARAPRPLEPAALLARYRARLVELVENAKAAAPSEPASLRAAVDLLVENVNADLLTLYRAAEHGALKPRDAAKLLPAFERLRNVLRHRDVRLCSMRDTLHKAVTGMSSMSQGAHDIG